MKQLRQIVNGAATPDSDMFDVWWPDCEDNKSALSCPDCGFVSLTNKHQAGDMVKLKCLGCNKSMEVELT